MATKSLREPLKGFFSVGRTISHCTFQQSRQCRSLTTESTTTPSQIIDQAYADARLSSTPTQPILQDDLISVAPQSLTTPTSKQYQPPQNPFLTTATCTLHAFPSLEPTKTITYPHTHLLLPLRRDILHRAVVFEGDMTRQGTASTQWRADVHGSNRKIRPQKGTGSARLGDKKSPMLRGGAPAFGPKPRDFSTELPRKLYDLAFRTALSYRYRKGELIVLEGPAEIDRTGPGSARWVKDMLTWHQWGRAHGRSLFVTAKERANLFDALGQDGMGAHARALQYEDVDVKDLLELGRIVIEKRALDLILKEHRRDLIPPKGNLAG